MQDVTPWPDSFDVSEPVARVIVDGQEADVESVTVSSELDSAMPERVAAGGGGVVAATGSASILRSDDVAEAGFNPWGDARQFVNASEVVVEAGYRDPATGGVGCARQITAQVESLDGGATNNSVGLDFVDATPTLDRDITIEPLLQEYPPLDDWGSKRGAGLSPIYITDRVLRHCGFYATPQRIYQAVLSAPMMGSVVPERGTLVTGRAASNPTYVPAFRPVPWGMGLGNGVVSYAPDFRWSGHGRLTEPLHVSFLRQRSTSPNPGNTTIEVRWGSPDDAIRVQAFWNGRLSVRYVHNGDAQLVATLEADDVDASEVFSITIDPSGQATIYASNGATATGTGDIPPRFVSQDMDEISVYVPQSSHPIGGVQVAYDDRWTRRFQRTAHIDPPAHYYSLRAFPFQNKVNCLDLLKDQAAAELAAMWIDEFGHFRWRNRHQLRGTTPRGTLTAKDNLLDLPWQVPVRSVFSRVELEYEVATVTIRSTPSITVSDSRGSTLADGDTEDQFFEPPADQDWHQVAPPRWLGGDVNYWLLRRGRGSYNGGIVVDDENTERIAYSSRLSQTWSTIGPQRWLLSSEAIGLEDDEYIEQSIRDRPDLYGKFAEENLPIIRARGLTEWGEDTTIGIAHGPDLAPVFVHKVGPWIQPHLGGADELQDLADWLAEQLTKPDVILRSIPIVPDPRIQLGDTFFLEDQSAYHVRARVVVMGKTLTYTATSSGHEMSQTITCRVIDVQRLGVRYDELETAWSGQDYAAFEAAWSGRDYDDLEADPLDRS